MNITFRDFVRILEIDAPVYFTPKEKLDKQNYVYCKFMTDAEATAIIDGNHNLNTDYGDDGIGLHFPDLGLDEYYDLERMRNPVGISTHICEISNQMSVKTEDIPLVFAVHCVLHEYGHWIHFKESELTPFDYCEQEKKERQPYENTAKKIYEMPDWDPYKRYLAERYEREIYSNFSSERAANKYALEHIKEALNKVFSFFN